MGFVSAHLAPKFKSRLSKRKFILNFSSQLAMSVLSQGILLFALPYAARVLGAEKFGEFNLATSFSAYATLLGSFGIILYSARELPRTDKVQENCQPYDHGSFGAECDSVHHHDCSRPFR